ncbi:unnamed protein product [Linum trigynum]|uniref:Uncharacterized protein n=1 Tax=Linum trigynum TaxID=586398 RepID=A0AAV2DWS1_9ROSI
MPTMSKGRGRSTPMMTPMMLTEGSSATDVPVTGDLTMTTKRGGAWHRRRWRGASTLTSFVGNRRGLMTIGGMEKMAAASGDGNTRGCRRRRR